jgi:hypothetical protein
MLRPKPRGDGEYQPFHRAADNMFSAVREV